MILPWARYRRIDPLGLGQNARWTDLLLATGLTGQLRKGQFSSHRSTNRCTLNTQPGTGHRSPGTDNTGHTGHWSHRVTGRTGQTGHTGQTKRTGHTGQTGCTGHTGSHRLTPVNTGQKALEVQDTQLLDRSELLVLNSPVRPVQLEHKVHESFDLLNSDSLDDRADESPERSILRHSGHHSPGTGHIGTSHTGHSGTSHNGHRSDREHSVHRSQ